MKYCCFVFVLIVFVVHQSVSQNAGDCDIIGISESQWEAFYENEALNDNDTLYIAFPAVSSISLVSFTSEYLRGEISDDSELVIETNENFIQYEENTASSATPPVLSATIVLSCGNGYNSFLSFRQPITDINNHEPSFTHEVYTIKTPMPLVANIDLAVFLGEDIIATDVDITNTWINFSIDSDNFTVTTNGPMDNLNKQYKAVIMAARALRYSESQTFILTATDVGTNPGLLRSTTTIVIEVDSDNSYPETPKFSKPYYEATYNNEEEIHTIKVSEPIILDSGNYRASLSINGDLLEYFTVDLIEDVVIVGLLRNLDETLLQTESTTILTIAAEVTGSDSPGSTVLIISLPLQCVDDSAPTTTECPICTTTEENCPAVTTEGTTECPETSTDCPVTECPLTTECPLPTECPDCPEIVTECPITTVTSDATECPVIEYTTAPACLECPETTTGLTVCPDCPVTECPYTTYYPECSETTACPECSVTTDKSVTDPDDDTTEPAPDPEVTLQFTQSFYRFDIDPNYTGTVGAVHASSTLDEAVSYSFLEAEENINIDASNGNIINTEYLTSGIHHLVVQGIGSTSGAVNTTNVVIYVDSVSICDGDIKTAYNVLVKHITEEQINEDIIILEDEDQAKGYKYVITSQYPTNGTDLFEINDESDSLQSKIIDREWATISDMYVSQFMVKLELVHTVNGNRRKRSSITDLFNGRLYEDDSKAWTYVDQVILNEPSEMIVFVIVDDINDNPPIFNAIDTVIGYPDSNLAFHIMPPYLTVVQATDPDEGYNASIYYVSDDHVYIHPVTGVVYPREDTLDDNFEFTVLAIDRNGTGLTSEPLTVHVKLLGEEQVFVLTVENYVLEDVDVLLSELSNLFGLTIKCLTASVIPKAQSPYRQRRDITHNYLRLVAYGLDENSEPILADSLKRLFENINTNVEWSVLSWEDYSNERNSGGSQVGLIVAVSILGALLTILLIGAGIFYYLKLRKRDSYDNMAENIYTNSLDNDSKKLRQFEEEKSNDGIAKGFVKNPKANETLKIQEDIPKRRLTGNILLLENRSEESSDDINSVDFEQFNAEDIKTSPVRERKKSVAFNDNVEKMHIEKEQETPDLNTESAE